MKEVKLRYNGTLFGKDTGLDLTPGKVYRAVESTSKSCYFIYDDYSIEVWGKYNVIMPNYNAFFVNREESIHFTEVE